MMASHASNLQTLDQIEDALSKQQHAVEHSKMMDKMQDMSDAVLHQVEPSFVPVEY